MRKARPPRRRRGRRQGLCPGQDDEFVKPTVIDGYHGMKDGDGLLMFNFRADRARQILTALLDPRFDGFQPPRVVKFAMAVGMVDYSAALNPSSRPCPARDHQGPGRDGVEGRAEAAAHRRDREVRPSHLLLQRRRGARVRGRRAHPGALAQGRDLRPEARDERAGVTDKRRRRHRLGQVRPDRRQLRQQRHGGPYRQPRRRHQGDRGGRCCLGR